MGAIKTEAYTAHEATTTIRLKQTLSQPSTMRGPDYALLSLVLDIAATMMTFVLANLIIPTLLDAPTFWVLNGIGIAVWMVVFFSASVYNVTRHYHFTEEIKRLTFAVGASALVFMGILYLTGFVLPRMFITSHIALNLAVLFGWRFVMRVALRAIQARKVEKKI